MNPLEKVIARLRTVMDPELRQDVYSLKLVYNISIDKDKRVLSATFRPSVPTCPIGIQLAIRIKEILLEMSEFDQVDVHVVDYHRAEEAETYLKAITKNEEAPDETGHIDR